MPIGLPRLLDDLAAEIEALDAVGAAFGKNGAAVAVAAGRVDDDGVLNKLTCPAIARPMLMMDPGERPLAWRQATPCRTKPVFWPLPSPFPN